MGRWEHLKEAMAYGQVGEVSTQMGPVFTFIWPSFLVSDAYETEFSANIQKRGFQSAGNIFMSAQEVNNIISPKTARNMLKEWDLKIE